MPVKTRILLWMFSLTMVALAGASLSSQLVKQTLPTIASAVWGS